jgi:hypothetical protein
LRWACSPRHSTPPPATPTRRPKSPPPLKTATGPTQRPKRSVFYNVLNYAVEQGHLAVNPVGRIRWIAPAVAATADWRVVVNTAQASEPHAWQASP